MGSPSSSILTHDTSRIGRVVHDCASRADLMRFRSSDAFDREGNGPGGRGASAYNFFQSKGSQERMWNHFETCQRGVSNRDSQCKLESDSLFATG
jgi:hypothetical protein